jgi:predicted NBD/HSP70 family sugar kinase/biotin operon repressor
MDLLDGNISESDLALSESTARALAALLESGATSRPQLSAATGLSKQTISLAMTELEERGLVEVVSSSQGRTGRSAFVYDLARTAGWLLGVDLGSTQIRLGATTLVGRRLDETQVEIPVKESRANTALARFAAGAINKFIAKNTAQCGPLLAVGVALSKSVGDLTDAHATALAPDLERVLSELGLPDEVAVYFENNVNCAALGELRGANGEARPTEFAYLQVGVGIGAGTVTAGRLVRGRTGEAGELRRLPNLLTDGPKFATAEDALGAQGVLARYAHRTGRQISSVSELFDLRDDEDADAVIEDEARGIAYLAAVLATVTDPECIVLGGGIGQNARLLPLVRREVERLGIHSTIKPNVLGDQATVAGASALAAEFTLERLVGHEAHRALRAYAGSWTSQATR